MEEVQTIRGRQVGFLQVNEDQIGETIGVFLGDSCSKFVNECLLIGKIFDEKSEGVLGQD